MLLEELMHIQVVHSFGWLLLLGLSSEAGKYLERRCCIVLGFGLLATRGYGQQMSKIGNQVGPFCKSTGLQCDSGKLGKAMLLDQLL
ncbi:unnamed protein product [Ilex paraguariensis]|uniref:Uncharacterized protein n=1 Tax=Ilex paraguariensis TaxID=185542 RepID=A0ABC8QLV6_9AQUA